MASKSTRGRKRAHKGQSSDELPPLARRKEGVEEFATLLEPPLEGPFATPYLGGGHGRLEVEGIKDTKEGEGGTLKWVKASNGEIPDDAVEGGWCQSTKEIIYVARASGYGGGLIPGYVKKSYQYCIFCQYGNNYQQNMQAYEVLVNPGNKAALQWVTSRGTIPTNAVEGGFSSPGKTLYIGRQSTTKKDIVPGYVDPADNKVHLIGSRYKGHTFKTFEVLVISGDVEIVEEVNQCILSNISYDIRQSDISEECISLATMTLKNKSLLEQTLTGTAILRYSTLFDWNISKKTNYLVEIKGGAPYLFGDDDVYISDNGVLPGFSNAHNQAVMLGGINNRANTMFLRGGVLGPAPNQQYGLGGLQLNQLNPEIPTMVSMKLGGALRKEVEQEKQVECRVSPNSEVVAEMCGLQKTLEVPFTGKVKKVYKNGMTAEEDVNGIYTYSTIVNIVPVVKEEKLEA